MVNDEIVLKITPIEKQSTLNNVQVDMDKYGHGRGGRFKDHKPILWDKK
jgi:hypothetical protein